MNVVGVAAVQDRLLRDEKFSFVSNRIEDDFLHVVVGEIFVFDGRMDHGGRTETLVDVDDVALVLPDDLGPPSS